MNKGIGNSMHILQRHSYHHMIHCIKALKIVSYVYSVWPKQKVKIKYDNVICYHLNKKYNIMEWAQLSAEIGLGLIVRFQNNILG